MKDFITVFSFYLKKQLKSKAFLITTVILCLISMASILMLNLVMNQNKKDTLYIIDHTSQLSKVWENDIYIANKIGNLSLDFSMKDSVASEAELMKIAKEEGKSIAIFTNEDNKILMNLLDKNKIGYNDMTLLQSLTQQIVQENTIADLGVSQQLLEEKMPTIDIKILSTSESSESFFTMVALLLLMVVVIIMYSNSASNEIAYLKTNRVMEIITTSVNPLPLYLGVNFAGGLIPFIQLAFTVLSGFLTKIIINIDFQDVTNSMGINLSALQFKTLAVYLILLLLGFFVYSFINTAIASIVSKAEDLVTVSVPIAFVGLIQYFVGAIAMESDSIITKIFSYIPITSPSVMFVRYSLGYAGIVEVIVSVVILVATIAILAYFGAGIFKYGTSYYGNLKGALTKTKKAVM